MTIKEALKKHHQIEIELLLAHVLKKPKEFVFMNGGRSLSAGQLISLSALIKRRENGEPIAYILGYKDFYGMRFKVNKDVLIPRPETEWVVERVIGVVQGRALPRLPERQAKGLHYKTPIKILDVGTGSGCIIISLAKTLSQSPSPSLSTVALAEADGRGVSLPAEALAKVGGEGYDFFASDISPAALKVTKQNARALLVKNFDTTEYDSFLPKIKFIQSDLFKNISGKFDLIIGNLPYVPAKYLKQNHPKRRWTEGLDYFTGLKFEPVFALTDGTDSWQIYRRFFEEVGGHLNPGGTILFEIDPASRKFLTEYQRKYLPSGDLKFYRDFNNLWRYAEITCVIPSPSTQGEGSL